MVRMRFALAFSEIATPLSAMTDKLKFNCTVGSPRLELLGGTAAEIRAMRPDARVRNAVDWRAVGALRGAGNHRFLGAEGDVFPIEVHGLVHLVEDLWRPECAQRGGQGLRSGGGGFELGSVEVGDAVFGNFKLIDGGLEAGGGDIGWWRRSQPQSSDDASSSHTGSSASTAAADTTYSATGASDRRLRR